MDLIFLKDLKAESEVQHPDPVKASRSRRSHYLSLYPLANFKI